MDILITGANGMLAQSIKAKFASPSNNLISTDAKALNITDLNTVLDFVNKTQPNVIINCAALSSFEQCEKNPDLANAVNTIGPKNLAIAARKNNVILVHVSTDYVFTGDIPLSQTYLEQDIKKPLSIYGKTKSLGENEVCNNCDKYYIFRTAWLYGEGKNFVRTMLELAKTHDTVKVVNDQHGSPTSADDLADIIMQVIDKHLPYGVYHATNQGFTTWYDFTKKIYDLAKIQCQVIPISSAEYPAPAERPKNSQLSKDKLLQYGINIPTWEDALSRYLTKEKQND